MVKPNIETYPNEKIIKKYPYGFDMMATKAYHKLGDISSEKPDLCTVYSETENYYIGQWVTGLGFFNVHFPKDSTRELTESEVEYYENLSLSMNNQDLGKIKIRRKV